MSEPLVVLTEWAAARFRYAAGKACATIGMVRLGGDGRARIRGVMSPCVPIVLATVTGIVASGAHGTPVPKQDHAAGQPDAISLYTQAFNLLKGKSPDGQGNAGAPLLTADEINEIIDAGSTGRLSPTGRAALSRAQPILDLLRQAARQDTIDFVPDRSAGIATTIPHLSPMRLAARILRTDAAVRLTDGDGEGAASAVGTLYRMTEHVARDDLAISSLVAASMATMAGETTRLAIDSAGLDPADAQRLLADMEALSARHGGDPFHFLEAVAGERQMIQDSVHRALDDPVALAELESMLSGGEGDEPSALAGMERDAVLADLERADEVMARVEMAFAEPDPNVARAILAEAEAKIAGGEAGELARLLAPSFSTFYERKLIAEADLAAQVELVREIATGARTPASMANAAVWYLRAASAAMGIAPDEQQYLEASRLLHGRVERATREHVATTLERLNEA